MAGSAIRWSQVTDRVGDENVPRSWDQRHAINLGVTWASGPWTATVINSFHSGWPTTQLPIDPVTGVPIIDFSARNRSRFADFNSLDMRLTRTFLMPRGALDVFVELTNATSRENPLLRRVQAAAECGRLGDLRARSQFLAAVDPVDRSAVAILIAPVRVAGIQPRDEVAVVVRQFRAAAPFGNVHHLLSCGRDQGSAVRRLVRVVMARQGTGSGLRRSDGHIAAM